MPAEITSLKNPRVKQAVKLRVGRNREKQGRFLIDGLREIERAMDAGLVMKELFVCLTQCGEETPGALMDRCSELGAEVLPVTPEIFRRIAFGNRSEGLLAVASMPRWTLAELKNLPANPLVAVIERVEKPGNLGAILRSAEGAGFDAAIVADPATDFFNPNVIRASMGALFTLPVAGAAADETARWLQRQGIRLVAAHVDGPIPYWQADFTGPTAIVLGSEASGLSSVFSGGKVTRVGLPMLGAVDSLNVSAAAAVLFYEALRQRSNSPHS